MGSDAATDGRRKVHLKAKAALDFPANFMLIASMNPCPVVLQSSEKNALPAGAVQKYLNKIGSVLVVLICMLRLHRFVC